MKNFILVLAVMTMGISNAQAGTQKKVTCTSNTNRSIFLEVVLDDSLSHSLNFHKLGVLNYEFSNADILCNGKVSIDKIKNSKSFRCAALYAYDEEVINKISEAVETVVEVNFTPSAVSDYEVEFKTNHLYGDLDIKLNCNVI